MVAKVRAYLVYIAHMWTYLESLRSKPDEYKMRFAYIASGVITAIIFGAWVWLTFIHVSASDAEKAAQARAELQSATAGQATSTIGSWDEIKRITEQMKKSFDEGLNTIESTIQATATTTVPAEAATSTPARAVNVPRRP